jgi:hypothetical protein
VLCGGAWAARFTRALALRRTPGHPAARVRGANLCALEAGFGRGVIDALRDRPIPFARLGLLDAERPGSVT